MGRAAAAGTATSGRSMVVRPIFGTSILGTSILGSSNFGMVENTLRCLVGLCVLSGGSGRRLVDLTGLVAVDGCGHRVGIVERQERRVDVEERLLLSLGEAGIAENGELDRPTHAVIRAEDAGPDVE